MAGFGPDGIAHVPLLQWGAPIKFCKNRDLKSQLHVAIKSLSVVFFKK